MQEMQREGTIFKEKEPLAEEGAICSRKNCREREPFVGRVYHLLVSGTIYGSEKGHLQGEGTIRWQRGPFAGIGGPQASLGAISRDRWLPEWVQGDICEGRNRPQGTTSDSAEGEREKDTCFGERLSARRLTFLETKGTICMERGTICRVRSYARKREPSSG